eukprot:CAMPEP_0180530630 /NCGR_PEP_ID=MMETSP1036_2-20121128/62043_1 /TAXON_ID=632150 /ORGANISM="Azadinium spinosum, Strain 3D9" /LENGTH=42 /DNA_ID= /DNA_START= /DNA_END= /DNA_ORIENTATION=
MVPILAHPLGPEKRHATQAHRLPCLVKNSGAFHLELAMLGDW